MNKIYDLLKFPARCTATLYNTFFILLLVGILLSSCKQEREDNISQPEQIEHLEPGLIRYQYNQLHLGVQVRIVLFAEKEVTAIEAATLAYAKIATLEDIFSNYRKDSEINRLIYTSPYEPVPVSTDLFTVLTFAQSLSKETGGAFDITLGPYISLWKESRVTRTLPDMIELESATQRVGWHHIELDAKAQSVTLQQKGMAIDMGGIAKGYILDEAMHVLASLGIDSALIEAGGDILVSGPPPKTTGWTIDIPGVDPESQIAKAARNLSHSAISTSGDTEQFVEIDGQRYSHVINPATGLGLTEHRLVTIIASQAIISDSYATAMGVMNNDERSEFLQDHPDIMSFVRNTK